MIRFRVHHKRIRIIDAIAFLGLASLIIFNGDSRGGAISPKGGGMMPEEVERLLYSQAGKGLFRQNHRWADRRRGLIRTPKIEGGIYRAPIRNSDLYINPLEGRLHIPVLMGLFAEAQLPVVDSLILDGVLFSGSSGKGTVTDYYSENSRGLLNVTGEVIGWLSLPGTENYYSGGFGSWGLDLEKSRTGEYIEDAVSSADRYTDFGDFDNDGPDGIPNSGDDDGIVDVLILVTPSFGAECAINNSHFWSHSGTYSIWSENGEPLATQDPSVSGGTVMIEDYVIAPSFSCDAVGGGGETEENVIEIGVFCHELGHSLGLVDLYDTSLYGVGIGYWGLMGDGAWNTPDSPSHLCAWSKYILGWTSVSDIGPKEMRLRLEPIGETGSVARLVVPATRFRRRECASGSGRYSLVCGCDESEAEARGWPDGAGYGNRWIESVTLGLSYDGSQPCSLSFDVVSDTEEGYDFGFLTVEHPGGIDTLKSYTGITARRRDDFELSSLLGSGPCDFVMRFGFTSDYINSDEDGRYDSDACAPFLVDDVMIKGGGIDYFSDFESDAGGWRYVYSRSEFFLASYRTRTGFDRHLLEEGMLVWHCDSSVAFSYLGNSGGVSNEQTRGVVLEEADGNYDLLISRDNMGDTGDPFPGSTSNADFRNDTSPSSGDNSGMETNVKISGITARSAFVEAYFRAGHMPPSLNEMVPETIEKSQYPGLFSAEIRGARLRYGTAVSIRKNGLESEAKKVSWLGEGRIIAEFDSSILTSGDYDLAVATDDGQSAVLEEALYVQSIYSSAEAEAVNGYVRIRWSIDGEPPYRAVVYRSEDGSDNEPVIPEGLSSNDGDFELEDRDLFPGKSYSYMITSTSGEIEESLRLEGSFEIEDLGLRLFQNYPNPFAWNTTLRFYLPQSEEADIYFFDVEGRMIASIEDNIYPRGYNTIDFTAKSGTFSPGLYFCQIRAGGREASIKMVILR